MARAASSPGPALDRFAVFRTTQQPGPRTVSRAVPRAPVRWRPYDAVQRNALRSKNAPMRLTIGTFNLNNLFSRWNFAASVDATAEPEGETVEVSYEFHGAPNQFRIRTYRGSLVNPKDSEDRRKVAERIAAMDVDVLAVQEVEDINTLERFAREDLATSGGSRLYRYWVLVEGNDSRFIDVGLLSKYPIGAVTSHRHEVHPDNPGTPVFGRDLLQVEIMNPTRSRRLLTLFNTHLKSHYIDRFEPDPAAAEAKNNARRRRQAEQSAAIIEQRTRPDSRFVVVGDMNDPPDSPHLAPLVRTQALALANALASPVETRPPKPESMGPGPQTSAWTYRHKESGQPPEFHLYDQIWLSPPLAPRQTGACIDRRATHTTSGSDHDPAWVELDL